MVWDRWILGLDTEVFGSFKFGLAFHIGSCLLCAMQEPQLTACEPFDVYAKPFSLWRFLVFPKKLLYRCSCIALSSCTFSLLEVIHPSHKIELKCMLVDLTSILRRFPYLNHSRCGRLHFITYLFRTHNVCTVGTTTAQFDVLFMQFHFLPISPLFLDWGKSPVSAISSFHLLIVLTGS